MTLDEARRMVAEADLVPLRAQLAQFTREMDDYPVRAHIPPEHPWHKSAERWCLEEVCAALRADIERLERVLER